MAELSFSYRRLATDDLVQMHRWLNEPGVVKWWHGDPRSWDDVVARYGPGNGDPTEHWIVEYNQRPIGWIQLWHARDYPEMFDTFQAIDPPPDVCGIDYLIGEPTDRGRGVGTAMLRQFCQTVFERPDAPSLIASDPARANEASWRALQGAGFERGPVIDDEGHVLDENDDPTAGYQLMTLWRPNTRENNDDP